MDLEAVARAARERFAAEVRSEQHADRYALAALVAWLDAAGVMDGKAFGAFLKQQGQLKDGGNRGDPRTLFVLGHMIQELTEPVDQAPPGRVN